MPRCDGCLQTLLPDVCHIRPAIPTCESPGEEGEPLLHRVGQFEEQLVYSTESKNRIEMGGLADDMQPTGLPQALGHSVPYMIKEVKTV